MDSQAFPVRSLAVEPRVRAGRSSFIRVAHVARVARLMMLTLGVAALAVQSAEGAASITLGSATAGPGEFGDVSVQFQSDTPTVALQFDVRFDPARLAAGYASNISATATYRVASSTVQPGLARVIIYSTGGSALANGAIASLPMRVLSPPILGPTPLTLTNLLFANTAAAPVQPVPGGNGSVTIRDSSGPRFEIPTIAFSGAVTLRLHAEDGRTYRIQASENLSTWQDLTTAAPVEGVLVYTDTATGTLPIRYYRAVEVP